MLCEIIYQEYLNIRILNNSIGGIVPYSGFAGLKNYVATYNKNNPELYTDIMKNLEEIENKDKIKEILDTAKIIKG